MPFSSARSRTIGVAFTSVLTALTQAGIETSSRPGLTPIQLVCVDDRATGCGTFQSHNQKVVSNRRGIFMTHIRSRNEAYTAQCWRLSWSTDGGERFRTLHTETNATNPPLLETDAADNLYLVRPDFVDGHAYLYRFLAREEYRRPHITRIPNGSAGKFAMVLDQSRRQLAYFAHNNTFHLVGLDGVVRSSVQLLAPGKNAILQYPLLCLGADGTLHAAWTTQAHDRYLYWDIHYLQSPDGGRSWRRMDSTLLTTPIVADEGGPADRITLDDEFEVHTWLSSFLVKDGKAHFLYLAQTNPPRQHYIRHDLATARRELDRQPELKGERLSLRNLDGFFAARTSAPGSTLYCVSRDGSQPRLACLASDDNGATWYDYAVSEPVSVPYSIGGCREISVDGWILGSFTDQLASTSDAGGGSKVYFFKIRAGLASARVKVTSKREREWTIEFADVHGQPTEVRFRHDKRRWGKWLAFAAEMTLPTKRAPSEFQLRSRLGTESAVFPCALREGGERQGKQSSRRQP
ncbi:MAG: hypothetical protein HYY24_04535 [Verrucomicrobia bacterium]|nr:hypothetical protein [Verrucomicrobiota bacterium]